MLFVLPSLTALGGGIELHGRTLVERLARRAPVTDIVVVARHEARLKRPEKVDPALRSRLVLRGPRSGRRVDFAGCVVREALALRPRIIHCGHLHHAPLALLAARLVGARLVVWAHGIEAWSVRSRLVRAALRATDRVVSVSAYTAAALLRQGLVSSRSSRVIANAIDFDRGFTPVALELDDLPRPRLLAVTRLDPAERYKGVEETLAALALSRLRVSYLVVGDGADRPRLEAIARRLGVRARFFGAVDDATLATLYRSVDLFVLPSAGEGFGYVFVEAMAAGLPVVAGDSGGARETLADGALGMLVDPGDPAAIAHAVDDQLMKRTQPSLRDGAHLASEAARRYGLARLDRDLDALMNELGA